MNNLKRTFVCIENEEEDGTVDDTVETKRRKIERLHQDEMEIDDCIEKQKNIGVLIHEIVKEQLESIFHIPKEIIQIIIEYNYWNVWYKNDVADSEWFQKIDKQIKFVYFTSDYMFVQTSNNEIWCRGINYYGELGLNHCNHVDEFVLNEYLIKTGIKITNIWVCNFTPERTFWADEAHKLYCSGYNESNEYGFGYQKTKIIKPELVENIKNVKQIAIGLSHSIILDQNGAVYSHKIGDHHDNYAQNGDGTNQFQNQDDKFHMIAFFKNIKINEISVGHLHTLFLTAEGNIYSCGENRRGQLGHCNQNSYARAYPKQIEFFKERKIKIKHCASGGSYNLVLSQTGEVYAFGDNQFGGMWFRY